MKAWLIRVVGVVQGVGFRPFIHRIATRSGLRGYVRNLGGSEVEILIEGSEQEFEVFKKLLLTEKPPPAKIEEIRVDEVKPSGFTGFKILKSGTERKKYSMIPPDFAICKDCLQEILDPEDRRFGYVLNSCALCGPRFSMMYTVPYDRENTAMKDFPMCDECRSEYEDPENMRRFHAQGICCRKCGPRIWLETCDGEIVEEVDPIREAARILDEGGIVGVKGVGGYHIAASATDDEVVMELRRRKERPQKPFALMALDIKVVRRHAYTCDLLERALSSPERPIVLFPRREDSLISDLVAPGLDLVGIMLPYTGIHYLLLSNVRDEILIMTSGNRKNLPMCKDPEIARREIGGFVDYFLQHNRRIVNRVDDSVIRPTAGRITMIRRSRGYAPTWIRIKGEFERPVVAFGAELQNTGAVAFDDKIILTQYVGDTDVYENLIDLDSFLRFFVNCYGIDVSKAVLVADMHPGYLSRKLAEMWAERSEAEVVLVQHHHAHVLSVAAERGIREKTIGIAVDGLGYGTDGTLWGGEVLEFDLEGFRRIAHLRPQPMPGGDRATRYPVRMLVGILSTFMEEDEILEVLTTRDLIKGLPGGLRELEICLSQIPDSPRISSMGRVLDAISALLGICMERTYEGEPAMKLEAVASKGRRILGGFELGCGPVIDTSKLFEKILEVEERPENIAYTCIYELGRALARASSKSQGKEVLMSGGAAVNSLLTLAVEEELRSKDIRLFVNERVPPGDGGISLGQVYRCSID